MHTGSASQLIKEFMMEFLAKLADMLGLINSSIDESDVEAYGVGAVMPCDLSNLALIESMTRQ